MNDDLDVSKHETCALRAWGKSTPTQNSARPFHALPAPRHGHKHSFMGFLDVDEFLVLHDHSVTSINDLLKR